ncbi:MAG: toll/interleukin-1 receptor domain-containing protein [Clostridia bacterium]|nr:toll/interleukin-1 receptor domain-containing protein [Clostridia bacterium]
MAKFYTEETVVKEPFLFVSYKHDDHKEIVLNGIQYLLEQGVRLWYDVDFYARMGDNWDDEAQKLIMHPNCRGMIFFNSVQSFVSGSIHKERSFALEKIKACGQKNFRLLGMNLAQPSILEIMRAVFQSIPDANQLALEFPLEHIRCLAELFNNDSTLYEFVPESVDPQHPETYMQRPLSTIMQNIKDAVNPVDLLDCNTITLGRFKNTPATNLPIKTPKTETIFPWANKRYIACADEDGVLSCYTIRDLTWRLLYAEGDACALIAEDMVDVRCGGAALTEWLTTTFRSLAFNDTELSRIRALRLATPEDLSHVQTDALLFPPSVIHPDGEWWIDAKASGALQQAVLKDGTLHKSGYNHRTVECGVRPVLIMDKTILAEIMKNNA